MRKRSKNTRSSIKLKGAPILRHTIGVDNFIDLLADALNLLLSGKNFYILVTINLDHYSNCHFNDISSEFKIFSEEFSKAIKKINPNLIIKEIKMVGETLLYRFLLNQLFLVITS